MKTYTVYYHTFPNGKMYFGQTCLSVDKRWKLNGSGYRTQSLMWNAIQKYGWDNIEHRIISTGLDKEEADFQERFYISSYRTNEPEFGYNIKDGGSNGGGYHISEEHRKKISEAHKGMTYSEESRNKMRESRKKWLENPENRMKCSLKGSKNGMYGVHRHGELSPGYGKHRKHTLEERRKIGKKVQRLSDGKIYHTITELMEEVNILTLQGIIYRIKNNKRINGQIYKYI